jgi:hypothetical protein
MKKFLILMLCIILICAMPCLTYATAEATAPVTEAETDTEFFTTEEIVAWVKGHIEEISVVITLIVTTIAAIGRNKSLNKSMATVNNNAVTIATDSKTAMDNASVSMGLMVAMANESKEEISRLLAEVRKNAKEKQELEAKLDEVTAFLKTAKLANVEFANELAELLVLANIPNSKKDELYARHLEAVNSIAEAEKTEVVENEAEEAAIAEAA